MGSDSSYKCCTYYSETWTENLSDLSRCANMARGNQRDQAREKAAKANKGKTKAASEQDANAGLTKEQRMERDAQRMREKQAAKAAQKAAEAAGKQ